MTQPARPRRGGLSGCMDNAPRNKNAHLAPIKRRWRITTTRTGVQIGDLQVHADGPLAAVQLAIRKLEADERVAPGVLTPRDLRAMEMPRVVMYRLLTRRRLPDSRRGGRQPTRARS